MQSIFSLFATLFIVLFSNICGDFYIPDRCAFPATCECHFDNDIASKKTWIESAGNDFINPLRNFLKYIPTPYEADCCHCFSCGGIDIDLYNDYEDATDTWVYEEISKAHTSVKCGHISYCHNDSDHCEKMCWDGGYFRQWNQKYSFFFKHFLHYSDENQACDCYWPETNLKAVRINDTAYDFIKDLCDDELIDQYFSPYWVANQISYEYNHKYYGKEYYPNSGSRWEPQKDSVSGLTIA